MPLRVSRSMYLIETRCCCSAAVDVITKMSMFLHLYRCMYTSIYICIYIYIYIYMQVCLHTCVCPCVCIHACIIMCEGSAAIAAVATVLAVAVVVALDAVTVVSLWMLLLTCQCLFISFSRFLARSPWLISSRYTNDPTHTRVSARCTALLASVLVPGHAKEGATKALPCKRRSPNPCSVVAASNLTVNSFERNCFNSSRRDHDKSPSLSFPAEIAFASLRACLHWSPSLQHLNITLR